MSAANHAFQSFVATQRTAHFGRLRVAVLLALVIGALLYETTWIALCPGLAILLAGQLLVAAALAIRIGQLKSIWNAETPPAPDSRAIALWFKSEETFLGRLTHGETLAQLLGFPLLGYEFWTATGSLWLALSIGLVYPLAMYFGISRRRNAAALRHLLSKKRAIAP